MPGQKVQSFWPFWRPLYLQNIITLLYGSKRQTVLCLSGFMFMSVETTESYFINSCQRSTMTSCARLWRSRTYLDQLGCLVSLISLPSMSDKQSSHVMILQRRYDLSGLEWLSSADCGQGDEE